MLRIAVVQFEPKIGKVQENVDVATQLCAQLERGDVDIVCLPEMSFTGYTFSSPAAVRPYLETPFEGPTSEFCRNVARRIGCHVVAGYPEIIERWTDDDQRVDTASTPLAKPELESPAVATGNSHYASTEGAAPSTSPIDDSELLIGANSVMVYAPDGCLLLNYRKTNLYSLDLPWCIPGDGFGSGLFEMTLSHEPVKPSSSIPSSSATHIAGSAPNPTSASRRRVRVALGICMDLNPFNAQPKPAPTSMAIPSPPLPCFHSHSMNAPIPGSGSFASYSCSHSPRPIPNPTAATPKVADRDLHHACSTIQRPDDGDTDAGPDAPGSRPEAYPAPAPAPHHSHARRPVEWVPSSWSAEVGPFELADFVEESKSDVLLMSNAWLNSGPLDEDASDEDEEDTDWRTLNYWAQRLRPLWAAQNGDTSTSPFEGKAKTVVVMCNRVGEENGIKFAGSSAVFSMTRNAGKPRLLDCMGREEEGLKVWQIPL